MVELIQTNQTLNDSEEQIKTRKSTKPKNTINKLTHSLTLPDDVWSLVDSNIDYINVHTRSQAMLSLLIKCGAYKVKVVQPITNNWK
jgi:hypothetical protein